MGKTRTEQCEKQGIIVENDVFPVVVGTKGGLCVNCPLLGGGMMMFFWFWYEEFFCFVDVSEVCEDCVTNGDFNNS